MKKTFNFAVLGIGMIAGIHARCIGELPNARLKAVCGGDRRKTEAFASEFGADAYTNYDEMLRNDEIDIVCILTPSGTHAELGMAAARAGKHVIVEKPIDISLERADRLIETCRVNDVKLCCISQHRYDHAVVELKKAADAGMLGQLNFGASHTKWYRSQKYYDDNVWRGTWAKDGGGALINQSIHYVDLLQYIMGPVEEVFAYCATRGHIRIEVEDIAAAAVKFASGAIGLIEANTAAYPGFSTRLDIYGTNGSVIIENDRVKEWKLANGYDYVPQAGEAVAKVGVSSADISHHSHMEQMRHFIACIEEGTETLVNGEEARRTLQTILSIYESARTGKPIKIVQ
jgi:UDP-N-acetyl-2-amino-2-deoxyglucuronate dehydrogenase